MAWIKSHQDLKDHPKLLQLCQMTGLNKAEAIGNLHIFWWWVLAYAEDGDLSKFNGGLAIDGLKLEDLKTCGFVDEDEKVHDWFDFAGRYLIDKYRTSNPKKLKSIVKRYSHDYRPTKVCKITQKIDKIDKIRLDKKEREEKSIAETSSAKPVKEKKEVNPQLKKVITHICDTWEKKKGSKYHFVGGKHASLISGICRTYGNPEAMALWDLYLFSSDEFFKTCGYSIECFVSSMPKLVDQPYKSVAKKYEKLLYPEIGVASGQIKIS